uniref:S-methyl-5'-thioadenosine phosphorylase n=1 Tax=Candidatus Kentrum eta TaxID=2126337 RepID=A0A450UHH2_9GAMM|nr:MAG: methylthioadenosine phosphorylase [Candidatus Kentron sp. H]VFJ91974.1 MAG: methylthioadenosine phosphorylase [Candidatus Kentron sp. H]VFJ98815.1 MAG: methylthioadenosine phosphorylase [Candidatus Kentron sp. H]
MANHKTQSVLGIIGGSGVYEFEGLTNTHWERIASPFGEPSDALLFGEFGGQPLAFLPRHGRGHRIPPSEINFRANIDVLKRAGVTDVISVSAVGSLREHLRPGMFVIVDQFIDRTFARHKSFFGGGLVAHVSMAHPVCRRLGDHVEVAARDAGIEVARGGTYLVMEGPQFSSLAESELYRAWHCDVIGMTNMPEAKLAREAELCYATVGMVTDYDCWHPNHDDVTVETIVRILRANADNAHGLVKALAPRVRGDSSAQDCGCRRALEHAFITAPDARDPERLKRLDAVAGRVLNADP